MEQRTNVTEEGWGIHYILTVRLGGPRIKIISMALYYLGTRENYIIALSHYASRAGRTSSRGDELSETTQKATEYIVNVTI